MNGNNITYRQQYSFCSKPGCRKCREGIGHGPYWYASQVVEGRTVRTYIGKTLPAGVQAEQVAAPSQSLTPKQKSSTTPSFRLTTLGMLRLESRDKDGNWQTVSDAGWRLPQARALLGCLVCAPGRQLTQQQAYERLWPEQDAKSAAQNIGRASTALGQIFGQVYTRQAGNILALAGQAQLLVDCEAFEELFAQAGTLPEAERAGRTLLLEQAIKLYGGDFFPEERAADWSRERRESLRRQWLAAALALADLYKDEQRPAAAIDLLAQVVATEPANEAATRRLMFLLACQQRRVEAVQIYQRLVTLLRNTYQAAPSPETQKLFFAIQQGDEELSWPLAAANKPVERSTAGEEAEMRAEPKNQRHIEGKQAPTDDGEQAADQQASKRATFEHGIAEIAIGRTNQSPLVGRDLEMAALYRMLAEVELTRGGQTIEDGGTRGASRRPRAHGVVLLGEPGIGKTRLAEESAREARRRGWTVVWSRAYQQEQGIPYRIWTAALRNILMYMPELALQTTEFASAATYQPLRALVPEMQEALIHAGSRSRSDSAVYESLSPEQEELRLREAVYTFLTTLSFASPLLIVLDDIQWIDDSSAQMLGYLTRRMNEHPIVLLATCRETDLALNRVLNSLIAHMQREQVVELIDVQPLSNEHIKALVSYLPAPAITQIQKQVAGNPFFAEELAYSLQTSSASEPPVLVSDQEEAQMLPGTIAAALNQRLNRLSNDCQNLLSRAAVLGGSFDFGLIAAMGIGGSASDDDTVLDLLDEALHAGVLTEEGSGAHITYHFWHPLLASHLYNGLSATRRAFLHRKIAEALRQIHQARESEEAATITQHLIRGGAEPARVAQYAELAAQRAYSLFAYSDAERYYRVALDHLAPALLEDSAQSTPQEQPLLPTKPLAQRLHLAFLTERLAECTRVRGNFQDAPNFYLRAIQLRIRTPHDVATPEEARQEAQIQAMLWSEIAWIWRFTGDSAAASDCNVRGEEALRQSGIVDGPAWGCLRHQQASLYWHEGYHQEALQAEHQALDLFTACLAQSAPHTAGQGSIPATRQTRTTRTLQGDPVDLGRAHAFLGIYYAAIGQLSEALKHLHEALTIYEQHDRRREVGHVCCNIGHVYLLKADYEQARLFLQRPQSYVEQSGDIPLKSVLLYNMGELAAAARQFDAAERYYREGLALVAQINDREYLSTWNAILGTMLLEQGRFKDAATVILRALAIGRAAPPNQPCIGSALVALAQLRCSLVESEHASLSARGRRWLKLAEIDLKRALSQRGLDAEKRTQALLTQAQVTSLLGNFSLARQQAQQASLNAQKYELQAIQTHCQQLLAMIPSE